MHERFAHITILLAVLACGRAQADAAASPLHVNPFLPPPDTTDAATAAREPAGSLEVRGVVVAGTHSLANIGGRIIGIGQKIGGYRLVSVTENNVVLDRGGVRRSLALRTAETGKDGHHESR
jgi:hypothetical protein